MFLWACKSKMAPANRHDPCRGFRARESVDARGILPQGLDLGLSAASPGAISAPPCRAGGA